MKKLKVKPFSDITVVVELDEKKDDEIRSKRTKKPLLDTPIDEILKRRKAKGVNFYDLGQVLSGSSWVDIDFIANNDNDNIVVSSLNVISYCDRDGFNPNGIEYHHTRFRNKIFEINPSEWRTRYRKLEYLDAWKYGVFVRDNYLLSGANSYEVAHEASGRSGDKSKWTASGLKVGELTKFNINSKQAFWNFDNNPVDFTITNLPSPTAPVVAPPTLKENADVFLVPVLMNWEYSVTYGGNLRDIQTGYAPVSRQFWLDRVLVDRPLGQFNYARNNGNAVQTGAEVLEIVQHLRTHLGAREFIKVGLTPIELVSGAIDPTATTNYFFSCGVDPASFSTFRTTSTTGILNKAANGGRFVGAIYQDNTWYYFWLCGSGAFVPNFGAWTSYGFYLPLL